MSEVTDGWKKSGDKQRLSKEDVLAKFRAAHGDYYDYSKVVYIRNKDKVEIMCPVHGSFMQTPRTHKEGGNCPKCAVKIMSSTKQLDLEEALKGFKAVHGVKYDYSSVVYKGSHTKIDIKCNIHGVFKQTPATHKKGSGCPKCGGAGFNPLAPAILYYVKVTAEEETLYKVGITNRSVIERFGADMPKVTVLKTWDYDVGADAYSAEQTILELNSDFKYTGPNVLRSGNTELFTVDVGGYDYE